MAVAFRNLSSTSYASSTTTSLTLPTGTQDNDILVVFLIAVAPDSISPPDASWTQLGSTMIMLDGSSTEEHTLVYWKRAASETGPYVFTMTRSGGAIVQQGACVAISGATTSGSPFDATSVNGGSTLATVSYSAGTGSADDTATGVTTTVAGDLLLALMVSWQGYAASPTGTFTEQLNDAALYIETKAGVSAGPTGDVVVTGLNNAGDPWTAWLLALKPSTVSWIPAINEDGSRVLHQFYREVMIEY